MTMMNGKEYVESLRDLNPEVYFLGQRIQSVVDEPMFQPHIHTAAMTYTLAHDPEYEEITTATSHLTGERVQDIYPVNQHRILGMISILHKPFETSMEIPWVEP